MGKDSGAQYDEAAQLANNAQLNFMAYGKMGKGEHEKALEYLNPKLALENLFHL